VLQAFAVELQESSDTQVARIIRDLIGYFSWLKKQLPPKHESSNMNDLMEELDKGTAKLGLRYVTFEVFTAVTMKNGVFWDVTSCGSCKNRRFGGTSRLLPQGGKNR
jgi:hypothetical protein